MTNVQPRLETLGPGHLDAVARLEGAVSPSPWSRELFAGELGLPDEVRHWQVAMDGDQLLGFGGVMVSADEAHIMNIAVSPERRRRGIATLLMTALLEAAIDRGATGATLEVRASNLPAVALYRKFGMAPVGVRNAYYLDGEDALILWVHDIVDEEYRAFLRAAHAESDCEPESLEVE